MTESQWLTSDNPAELVAFLGERITDEQLNYFLEAAIDPARRSDFEPQVVVESWSRRARLEVFRGPFMARGHSNLQPLEVRAEILRDIVGNPFRRYAFWREDWGHTPKDWDVAYPGMLHLDSEWLTWSNRTIPLMVDAMMFEDCERCSGHNGERYINFDNPMELFCPLCNKGRIPRAEPRWEMMPVIADALEEAGCRNQHILEHLRSERDGERCALCDGSGSQIHVYGRGEHGDCEQESCDYCEGMGRIKRRHWKGCHILEVLTHGI